MTFPSFEAHFLNSQGPALIFITSVPYLKAVFALVGVLWFCPYSKRDSQVGIWEMQYSCNWFLGSFLVFNSVHYTEFPDLSKLPRAKRVYIHLREMFKKQQFEDDALGTVVTESF